MNIYPNLTTRQFNLGKQDCHCTIDPAPEPREVLGKHARAKLRSSPPPPAVGQPACPSLPVAEETISHLPLCSKSSPRLQQSPLHLPHTPLGHSQHRMLRLPPRCPKQQPGEMLPSQH